MYTLLFQVVNVPVSYSHWTKRSVYLNGFSEAYINCLVIGSIISNVASFFTKPQNYTVCLELQCTSMSKMDLYFKDLSLCVY